LKGWGWFRYLGRVVFHLQLFSVDLLKKEPHPGVKNTKASSSVPTLPFVFPMLSFPSACKAALAHKGFVTGWWERLGARSGGFRKGTHHGRPPPAITHAGLGVPMGCPCPPALSCRLQKLLEAYAESHVLVESRRGQHPGEAPTGCGHLLVSGPALVTGRAISKTSTICTFRKLVQAYLKQVWERRCPPRRHLAKPPCTEQPSAIAPSRPWIPARAGTGSTGICQSRLDLQKGGERNLLLSQHSSYLHHIVELSEPWHPTALPETLSPQDLSLPVWAHTRSGPAEKSLLEDDV